MNPPQIADYTTRKSYQQNYAKDNREAINARKRAWRLARKLKEPVAQTTQQTTQRDT
jgi:hypothetical protein